MKLQQGVSKLSLIGSSEPSVGIACNFKEKIPTYMKEIKLSNIVQEQTTNAISPSIIKSIQLETQKNQLKSDLSTILQTSHKLYLFLIRNVMVSYSELVVYEYMKVDGSHKSMQFTGIKGQVVFLKAKFCNKRKQRKNCENKPIKNTKKSLSLKNTQNRLEIVVLMGTSAGYLKTLRFPDKDKLQDMKVQIESLKLDYTAIINISVLDQGSFFNTNICLALSSANKVYLVNFDIMLTLVHFLPTIINCSVGMGLSVNAEQKYFIQTTEGGYIIFWDLSEYICQLIKKSTEQKVQFSQNKQRSSADYGTFTPDSIFHCITPINIFHSATIQGLKYCQLYGNLLLLITRNGFLKLLAINSTSHNHMNQNEFCSLIEYQIENGELVSDVKFFPDKMEIFIVKSMVFQGKGHQKYMPIKEFDMDKETSKAKKTAKVPTKPYKPKTYRDMRLNVLPDKGLGNKSSHKGQQSKCFFERIIFNSQLQIQKVSRIFPSQGINCIQSLEMTQSREIIVLRGKEFYLIGSTQIFNDEE